MRARTPAELHVLRRLDFDQLLARLEPDMLTHLEATARARLDDTRVKLAALTADGPLPSAR